MLMRAMGLFALLSLAASLPPAPPSPGGGEETAWITTIGSSALTLSATQTTPGSRGNTTPRGTDGDTDPPVKNDPCPSDQMFTATCGIYGVLVTSPEGGSLTISDLARFAPAPVATTIEPQGVGVAGLPTNFVTPATVHTQEGTLLDLPVTVRFTPVAFDTTFGDDTTATTTTGGQSWTTTHLPPFTPTPTTHVYRDRGTYTTSTTVRYTAEVDLGTGWFTVPGELPVPGPAHSIRIYQATTALVRHTCTERPTAPGC